MPTLALLFADDGMGEPCIVAGDSCLTRQILQVRQAGIDRVLVYGSVDIERAEAVVDASALLRIVGESDLIVTVAAGVVTDSRVLAAVLRAPVPAVAAFAASADVPQRGVERLDANYFAAGIGCYPGASVRRIAAQLGEWDLHSTLLRSALGDPACQLLDLDEISCEDPGVHRAVPLRWSRPDTPEAAVAVTAQLADDAQSTSFDWPTLYVVAPIRRLLLRYAADARVPPLAIAAGALTIGLAAIVVIASGWLTIGLLLMLAVDIVSGVDESLGRLRLRVSRWQGVTAVLGDLVDAGWYVALGARLAALQGNDGPYAVAALLILFVVAERGQLGFYNQFTGVPLARAGQAEARLALVASNRISRHWLIVPFAVFGAWYPALVAVAGYAVVSYFVTGWRCAVRLLATRRTQA